MKKRFEIKTYDGKTIRVMAVCNTNLFCTKVTWDLYFLEGFFEQARYFAKAEDESLIPDGIRANISNVSSINPIK